MIWLERIFDPSYLDLPRFLARPTDTGEDVSATVARILREVRDRGDEALFEYGRKFDGVSLARLGVSGEELANAGTLLPAALRQAIARARDNIRRFHEAQKPNDEHIETEPGIFCWRKSVPIEQVGIYVPGGSAPLFSTVLMLAVPATIAGCSRVILCTPPQSDGTIHPAILHAAYVSGVTEVFAVGGAQAIGAMAWGTESIPKVDKIFGPGNRFVTEAKIQVSGSACAIDMPAGPSEVMVVIDHAADPAFAAADLLSQAEHGPDSQAILVVIADDLHAGDLLVDAVEHHLDNQLSRLGRRHLAVRSLGHSKAVIVTEPEQAVMVINSYGPEHLLLQSATAEVLAGYVRNAGSVFIGPWSCESAGDYASGTNHTLPTNGWARAYSGVSLDSYFKKITFQRLERKALCSLGPDIRIMAEAESLDAHAEAVRIRLSRNCEVST